MSVPCTPRAPAPMPSTPSGRPHLATARDLFRRMIREDNNGCSSSSTHTAPMQSPPLTPKADPFATPKKPRAYILGPAAAIPIPATPVFTLAASNLRNKVVLPTTPPPTSERTAAVPARCPTTPVKLGSPVRLCTMPMTPPSRPRPANPPPLVRSKSTFSTPLYRPVPPPVCMLLTPTTRPDQRVLLERIAKLEHMVLGLQRQVAEHKTTGARRSRKAAAAKPLMKRRIGRVRLGQVL